MLIPLLQRTILITAGRGVAPTSTTLTFLARPRVYTIFAQPRPRP